MATFADAFVRLRIDQGQLRRDTSQAMKGPEARQAGERAGMEFSAGAKASAAKGGQDLRAVLFGVAGAFAPVVGAAAAAGVGVAAFGVLAVPSVVKVTKALTGPGGLAASWGTLDRQQRNAAVGIKQIGAEYKATSQKMDPRTFQVFFQVLHFGQAELKQAAQLFDQGALGVSDFLATFQQSSGLHQFIDYSRQNVRPALDAVGGGVTSLTHLVLTLLKAFEGPGIIELRALGTVFTGLDHAISFLEQHAPGLTSVALGIGGVAFALAKVKLLSGVLSITGLGSITGQFKGFIGATKGATLAEKGLLAVTTAFEAITPWGWVALGITALAGLVFWLSRLDDGTKKQIDTITAQHRAQGFNTQGYFDAAKAVQDLATQEQARTDKLVKTTQYGRYAAGVLAQQAQKTGELTAAQRKLVDEGTNQLTFLNELQSRYGLTQQQAVSLAKHSGVLASQVSKGGDAMHAALLQTEAYADANKRAQRPTTQFATDMETFANRTLQAKDRLTGLTDALKLFFDPAVTADQDLNTLKTDQWALTKALQASGGATGRLTQKQIDARSAFDAYIGQVAQAAQSAFTATGRTSSYTRVIQGALPFLERAAGHNRALRQEIQRLIDTETGLRTENVAIHVTASGSWAVVAGGHRVKQPGAPAAAGMRVTGGIPGVDSVPILAQRDETVLSVAHSAMLAPLLAAVGVPGYAAGGVVGRYSSPNLGGLNKWLLSENQQTISAIATATAAALHHAASAPAPGGGHVGWHPGGGVAQWQGVVSSALAQLGLPQTYELLVLYQMMTESGGNPNIVNTTDSNWLAGHPSVGLMQVIAGTFAANAGPYLNTGPFEYGVSVDPMANVFAALHYGTTNGRGFGTGPGQIGSGHGYKNGGWLDEPMLGIGLNTGRINTLAEAGPELVTSGRGLDALAGLLEDIREAVYANADITADGVASALGVAASRASGLARYGA